MKSDSIERYGTVSRFFHWVIATLVLWQAMKVFDRINDGEHWVGETLVPWHISIGALILVLVLLRIVWASRNLSNRPPAPPGVLGVLARAGHIIIYIALVFLPIAGMSFMIGKGHGLTIFGMELVSRGTEIPWLAAIGELHSPVALFLLAVLAGHVVMAFWHQFVRKDGLLRRML
ncbi:cytochrome b [Idiomarina sp. HP20-50]|uniref:cytochrome b n=1 Tax=Idiomarina sp. HP20-50 TaxID=3070813 RepID=UPI00294AB472|nr:cytochrome b/b6 domain-containing protein [Idiomarina sp. HP20-50]MDV6316440.1 cytochrome b/b6 domain-containing protein [Idiomarina sp. HP20-50]